MQIDPDDKAGGDCNNKLKKDDKGDKGPCSDSAYGNGTMEDDLYIEGPHDLVVVTLKRSALKEVSENMSQDYIRNEHIPGDFKAKEKGWTTINDGSSLGTGVASVWACTGFGPEPLAIGCGVFVAVASWIFHSGIQGNIEAANNLDYFIDAQELFWDESHKEGASQDEELYISVTNDSLEVQGNTIKMNSAWYNKQVAPYLLGRTCKVLP